ncbi:MAG TPA: hypothetical protein VD815_06195 [Candidatus Saccharimonadales bacterium]|nr:hypothetical protein [Candidatus Saccharimonadales bacterium]
MTNLTFVLFFVSLAVGAFVIVFGTFGQTVYAQNTSATLDQFRTGNESQNKIMEQNLTDVIFFFRFP